MKHHFPPPFPLCSKNQRCKTNARPAIADMTGVPYIKADWIMQSGRGGSGPVCFPEYSRSVNEVE